MAVVRLMHVKSVTVKGRTYHYHRKTRERLPDEANARGLRVLEINASLKQGATKRTRTGSFDELIARFKASPEFTELADVTRRDYVRHLDAIGAAWGHLAVAGLLAGGVRDMRDSLARTPRTANYRLAVLGRLINFGIGLDGVLYGRHNAVAEFNKAAGRHAKLKQGGGYHPWPDNVIGAFAEAAYPELRWLVIGGALGTGQRGGDLIAMPWSHVGPDGWELRQAKTGETLLLPYTTEFTEALSEIPRRALVVFTTKTGRPWNAGHLRHEVQRTLEKVGFPGYSLHGLRYKAARRLYEAGATWDEVAAVTGHRSMEMARQYALKAERAANGVAKLQGQFAKLVQTE